MKAGEDVNDVFTEKNGVLDEQDAADGVITYARTRADADALVWLNADGSAASLSPVAILEALACRPNTPALPRLDQHHSLVRQALQGLRDESGAAMGVLGNRGSVKFRLYELLSTFQKENEGTLLDTPELKAAITDVFLLPLREDAKITLGRMIRGRQTPLRIVEHALELARQDSLVIRHEDAAPAREPRIVCSLGLTQG